MGSKPTGSNATAAPITLRDPPYTYFHLSVKHVNPLATVPPPLDAITARTYLTSALAQLLGLTGAAISIDILKVAGQHFWIRVARQDGGVVVAGLAQWTHVANGVSVKIEASGDWLGGVVVRGSQTEDLFSL